MTIPPKVSNAFSLAWHDLRPLAVGALIASSGGLLAYLATLQTGADMSTGKGIAVSVLSGILINVLRKFVFDTSPK